MIPVYINNWLTVIEQMNNDNTYKLAWGRAVVECVSFDSFINIEDNIFVEFSNIALNMLKYYWNQIFFFNLKQSPYINKNPVICAIAQELIDDYKRKTGNIIPVWFDEALKWFNKNDKKAFDKAIQKISKTLHENVSWRFLNGTDGSLPLYVYEKETSRIKFTKNEVSLIKEYSVIISKLLNYKWSQLLEQYNCSPKIASKVNGISEAKLRRNSLAKYKNELLKEFKGRQPIDFYSGEPLKLDDISVDHVIPWSFMYSDDIWNLVLTSKSNNSKKSNSIPTQETIDKLNQRNSELSNVLSGSNKMILDEAINNKYVDKFYYQCRL